MHRTRPRTPRVAVAAATALAALGAAVPAGAAPDYYGVEVDATVETSYTGHAASPTFEHDSSLSTSTHVTAGFLAVIERDATGRIIGASGEDQHQAATTGTITTREREQDAGGTDWWERGTSCVGAGPNRNDEGRTSLRPDPLTPLVGAALELNLADQLLVEMACTDTGRHGGAGPRSFVLRSAVPDDEPGGGGPLSVSFDLPPEATRAGKVIQLFEGPEEGHAAYCPEALAEQPHRKSCNVRFRGTITFEKTDLGIDGGTAPPASPGPAWPPAPPASPAPPVPPATGGGSTASGAPRPAIPGAQRARLDARARRLTFRATCPGGCTGTATLRVRTGRGAATRKLAVLDVRVPRGTRARTVGVAIPARLRRTLRRAHGARVVLALKDRGDGRRATATLPLTR